MSRPKRRVVATGIVGLGARAFRSRAMVISTPGGKRAGMPTAALCVGQP